MKLYLYIFPGQLCSSKTRILIKIPRCLMHFYLIFTLLEHCFLLFLVGGEYWGEARVSLPSETGLDPRNGLQMLKPWEGSLLHHFHHRQPILRQQHTTFQILSFLKILFFNKNRFFLVRFIISTARCSSSHNSLRGIHSSPLYSYILLRSLPLTTAF